MLSMILSISIILGYIVVYNIKSNAADMENNIINTQANEYTNTNVVNNDFIEYLRKLDKDITIFTIDELYKRLNNEQDISSDNIEGILASSSDDVIKEYVTKEIINSIEIFEQLSDSTNIVLKNEDVDYIKDINTQELQSKSGSNFKMISTVENKYGTTMSFNTIDMDDSSLITRENWFPLIPSTSTATVKYGDRSFVYDGIIKIGTFKVYGVKSTYKYKVSENGLKAGEIKTKVENIIPSAINLSVLNKKYTDTSASKVGENIDGYVKIEMQGQWLGFVQIARVRQKYNVSIKIKKWDKKKKNMQVQYSVKPYQDFAL